MNIFHDTFPLKILYIITKKNKRKNKSQRPYASLRDLIKEKKGGGESIETSNQIDVSFK